MKAMTVPEFAVPTYDDELPPLVLARQPDVKRQSVSVGVNVSGHSRFVEETPADTTNRTRWNFRFNLNVRSSREYRLALWLDDLKGERSFTTVIRNALNLYRDLQAGNIDTLLKMFPWVTECLKAQQSAEVETLKAQLDKIEAMLAQPPAQPAGPRALSVPPMPAPVDEPEVELVIRKAKSDGKASCENFLASAFALIQ